MAGTAGGQAPRNFNDDTKIQHNLSESKESFIMPVTGNINSKLRDIHRDQVGKKVLANQTKFPLPGQVYRFL